MLIFYFAILTILANGCLAVENRVINGEPAAPHQFPYHVGIFWKSKVPLIKPRLYCGGAVVSNRWVLTAAHCIPRFGQIIVKGGKHVLNEEESSEQIRSVVRHVIHPEYKSPITSKRLIAQNDIALLEVDSSFAFNGYIAPAMLPKSGAFFESGSLAGWGSTGQGYVPSFPNVLHYNRYLPVVDPQTCTDAINAVVFGIDLLSVEITSNQTCSGPVGESFGACILDGGSAFVQKREDSYEVIGIVSWNHLPCGSSGVPTVYTRVAAYSEWIQGVVDSVPDPENYDM